MATTVTSKEKCTYFTKNTYLTQTEHLFLSVSPRQSPRYKSHPIGCSILYEWSLSMFVLV